VWPGEGMPDGIVEQSRISQGSEAQAGTRRSEIELMQ
jgi:hypothetical protein